jgi:hypothetical protein
VKYEIEKLAAPINFDSQAFTNRIRFCPCCGTGNLARSDRTVDPQGKMIQGKELWCGLCGFSFNLRPSVEWNIAIRLFKEHRSLRGGVKFMERFIEPQVLAAWKVVYEKPKAENVWPSHGGFSLGEKLKLALGG